MVMNLLIQSQFFYQILLEFEIIDSYKDWKINCFENIFKFYFFHDKSVLFIGVISQFLLFASSLICLLFLI